MSTTRRCVQAFCLTVFVCLAVELPRQFVLLCRGNAFLRLDLLAAALELRLREEGLMPYVRKGCTGCGICEKDCPLEGESAVRVESTEFGGGESV